MINPVPIDHSVETNKAIEGCLSYPGVFCEVERPNNVTIEFSDIEFNKHIEAFTDFVARIAFHELDHLLGKCIVRERGIES